MSYIVFAVICLFACTAVQGASLKRLVQTLDHELPFESEAELDSAQLIRRPVMTILTPPESQTAYIGQPVTLRCEVTGVTVPIVHWLKDGKPIKSPEANDGNIYEKIMNIGRRTYQDTATTAVHHIPCATAQDAGRYTCVANNAAGKVFADAVLTVEQGNELPQNHGCEVEKEAGEAARITMWSNYRVEREGAKVQLMCRATGSPPPRIFWTDENGAVIHSGSKYQVLQNGDLLLLNTRADDFLLSFHCIATNAHGKDSVEGIFMATKYDGEDEM